MIVGAISDLHGQISNIHVKKCDIFCICGDIVPLRMQNHTKESFNWFEEKFIPWCQSIECDQVYLIGGNHDFFMENNKSRVNKCLLGSKITYLENEGTEYLDSETGKVYKIWGSPLCHTFGYWAFMHSPEYEKEQFEKMPNDLDILLTHDAAFGHSDICLENPLPGNIGNRELKSVISKRKPRYHLFGHLHTADHNLINYDGTLTACVSALNEHYQCVFKPLYIETEF